MFLLVQTQTSSELSSDLVVVSGGGEWGGGGGFLSRIQLNILKYSGITEAVHLALQLTRSWALIRKYVLAILPLTDLVPTPGLFSSPVPISSACCLLCMTYSL